MANWAITDYVIEGPKDILQKIKDAIANHEVAEGSSHGWEGNILNALNISYEKQAIQQNGDHLEVTGYYMRGFITDEAWFDDGTLRFYAEEAWGVTDFYKVLEKEFPEIKVFYKVEEPDDCVYATNDKEGKYFPERFYVDICYKGNYESEYFIFEDAVYKWINEITASEISTAEEVEAFNDANENGEDFIHVYEFDVL